MKTGPSRNQTNAMRLLSEKLLNFILSADRRAFTLRKTGLVCDWYVYTHCSAPQLQRRLTSSIRVCRLLLDTRSTLPLSEVLIPLLSSEGS